MPLAKEQLATDDRMLGLLLLCLGTGSVIAMLSTSVSNAVWQQAPYPRGGVGLAIILPCLAIADTPVRLGATLFAFGVSLGSIDVAMNIHPIELERATGRPLMSGFHAQYSIGEFTGSAAVTSFLSLQLGSLFLTVVCSPLVTIATVSAWPGLLATGSRQRDHCLSCPFAVCC
ncbi:hypothetical protein GA0061099_101349 [Bradyrhizobium yuanmingense]|uniref:Major Facilitator Superfamily protein n=1 Tax=Bradyrhizobium yuanmingense TaxID=108015 RepID=A0A1C3XF02_9BRAD|nr:MULTISPECIES: hypothetical protein [Bradyrhizobium]MCA1543535.1 hypothetical protein [Bradyrhizobium sp. NBAIM32]TWI19286.1 hypothetical protein IQ15_06909 [Bradyrhizobium yuanmingense]SCB50860.1 hypothetical protein GA0061099_101349 [Bradyrhizobium yuanmingense]